MGALVTHKLQRLATSFVASSTSVIHPSDAKHTLMRLGTENRSQRRIRRIAPPPLRVARLQGEKIKRLLAVSLPKDGVEGVAAGTLMVAQKPAYGTADIPRGIWKTLHTEVSKCGITITQGCYAKTHQSDATRCHVDGRFWCGWEITRADG